MSRSAATSGFAAQRVIDVEAPPSRRQHSRAPAPSPELEQQLTALRRDYDDLHAALFEATQAYRRLCPPRLIKNGDFEIASEIFAARYLPGDFFTVQESNGNMILGLGDICGKGLAAGMWTTHLVGLVGAHTVTSPEPQAIVGAVNRDLCRMSSVAPLASMFLARLDPVSGTLDYSIAGHPPVIVLRENGRIELLCEGGPLLGVMPAARFATGRVDLKPGDVLLAYSDGILESRNDADQEFGYQRLEAQLRRSRTGSADAILFSVLGAVQDFAGACSQGDDMSLVVVRRTRP